MSATDVLKEIQRRGIVLDVQGGRLRYRARMGSLTPELREALARYKTEIIGALSASKPAVCARARVVGEDAVISQTGSKAGCPGPEKCSGCYSIGVVDGRERFLHPPKGKPISWPMLKPATEKVQ